MAEQEEQPSRTSLLRGKVLSTLGGVRRSVASATEKLKSTQTAEQLGAAVELRRLIKKASDAQRRGNHAMAYRLLEPEVRDKPDDPRVVVAFWSAAVACERAEAAVPAMVGIIRKLASTGKAGRAAELWMELRQATSSQLVDPNSLVRMVPPLQADGLHDQVVEVLREAVDPRNRELSPGLAVRIAELARELDPPTALAAARRALATPDLHEARRARLETLVADLEKAKAEAAPKARPGRVPEAGAGTTVGKPTDPSGPTDPADPADPAHKVASPPAPKPGDPTDRVAPAPAAKPAARAAKKSAPAPAAKPAARAAKKSAPAPAAKPAARAETKSAPAPVERPRAAQPRVAAPPEEPEAVIEVAVKHQPEAVVEVAVEQALGTVAPAARFDEIKLTEAMPTSLQEDAVALQLLGGRKARLEYTKIEAVAVAEVRDPAMGPVVLVDLVFNWREPGDRTVHVLRLRSDGFDPRMMIAASGDASDAFRSFLSELLARTNAVPLPDPDSALGVKLRSFASVEAYQREVLQVGSPASRRQ